MLSGKPHNDTAADVQEKLWPILKRAWRFWPFVHLVTYSVIPPTQRILWVNCVDLVWSSILAGMASPPDAAESDTLGADHSDRGKEAEGSVPEKGHPVLGA